MNIGELMTPKPIDMGVESQKAQIQHQIAIPDAYTNMPGEPGMGHMSQWADSRRIWWQRDPKMRFVIAA